MKTKLYHFLLVGVCLFAACKKDKNATAVTTPRTTNSSEQLDSISFTVNGKDYAIVSAPSDGNTGWTSTNNVESYVNQQYQFSDTRDTDLFFNNIILSDTKNWPASGTTVQVSFFKKFNNTTPNFNTGVIFYFLPAADQLKLYATGEHVFATDYMRRSNTDGVGLVVNGIGSTYSQKLLGETSAITQSMQNNSSFVITSLTKVKGTDTKYLLKGSFNTTLFDGNEQPLSLTHGRISMIVTTYN